MCDTLFCTHPDTNIINEMIASSFFFVNENRWKAKKKKKEKERKKEKKKKLLERSWAHFILMKPWEEG